MNRGVNKRLIFKQVADYRRALHTLRYYTFSNPPLKYSDFIKLSDQERNTKLEALERSKKIVEIVTFVFMPNHFHFLLLQLDDNGISKFMANFQNSYSRYFNTKNTRIGHLFQGQFKAIRIETNEQLLHVSRYIHLNPSTSFLIGPNEDLINYRWSSYLEYIGEPIHHICQKKIILSQFSKAYSYQMFITDQIGYQKELSRIEHLLLEEQESHFGSGI